VNTRMLKGSCSTDFRSDEWLGRASLPQADASVKAKASEIVRSVDTINSL
jgi:hypothetical protein